MWWEGAVGQGIMIDCRRYTGEKMQARLIPAGHAQSRGLRRCCGWCGRFIVQVQLVRWWDIDAAPRLCQWR